MNMTKVKSSTEDYRNLSPAHGNTMAAWALVGIVILGSIIAAVGFCIPQIVVFWLGIAVIIVGFIVGFIFKKMGYGVNEKEKTVSRLR